MEMDRLLTELFDATSCPSLFPELDSLVFSSNEEKEQTMDEAVEEQDEEEDSLPQPLFADVQRLFHRVKTIVPSFCKFNSLRVFYRGQEITQCPTCKKYIEVLHNKIRFPCTFRHYKKREPEPILLQWDHRSARGMVCEAYVLLASYRGYGDNNRGFCVDIH